MGGSSNDEDSATDSDNSSGDLPESNSCLFSEGEKVLAYHGPRIYEAKVQKLRLERTSGDTLSITLAGIKSRLYLLKLGYVANSWDEWVGMDRLMKHTEENVLKQQALDKKQGADKNLKSVRATHTKPKILSDAKLDKEDSRNTGTKGKKRKSDIDAEKEDDIHGEKLVRIQIPSPLKKQLVDDWESITRQDKLVKLPRSPNVDTILSKYMEYRSTKDGMMTDQAQEIMNGLRCYFDKALPVLLLYKKERQQYSEAVVDQASPSSIYGAEHLLRLFVKLPELLAYAKIEEETLLRLQQKLNDFLKFVQKNQGTFFLSSYDDSKVFDGSGKGKDN